MRRKSESSTRSVASRQRLNRSYYLSRPATLLSLTTTLLLTLLGCPADDEDQLPSCEELQCQGGSVCIDGACRARACLETNCPDGTVCQGGPLCLPDIEAFDTPCQMTCQEGTTCQEGPLCRDSSEDLDGDGAPSQIDCDDGDSNRLPGNPEICDGLDNDCNGAIDNEAPCLTGRRCCGTAGCVDPLTNREHCGTCGQGCEIYEECVEGRCQDGDAPLLTAVEPDPLPTGQWFGREGDNSFVIRGEHLLGYATVYLESADGLSQAAPFEVVTTTAGLAYTTDQPMLIDGADLPGGAARIRVIRNDGAESNWLDITVEGAPPPVITSVSPDPFMLADESIFSVYGSGFWGEASVSIAENVDPLFWLELPVQWVSDTWLRTGSITLSPQENTAGEWLAIVRNPDGVESDPYAFIVEPAPPPELTGISPTEGNLDSEITLEIFGYDMFGEPEVLIAPSSTPENPLPPLEIALADPRRVVTEPFILERGLFEAGPYDVWIVNPDGTPSAARRFTVLE